MARFTHLKTYPKFSSLCMPYTLLYTFSKGTKIKFDSVVMILDDPLAPSSFDDL
ncbi:putative spermidine synthase [Gossypium arboreum]|uniref:Putative spermidine synthase n=1 Tax=Gossypium arboreum TaxID=29729 RepID=A0A0B0PHH3_GOSAR|nr:putative spermidine synthase [Gossypium arboreum]